MADDIIVATRKTVLTTADYAAGVYESGTAVTPTGSASYEVSMPLAQQEDTKASLTVDTYLSEDSGRSWTHRHRDYWRGGIFTHKITGLKVPRACIVGLGGWAKNSTNQIKVICSSADTFTFGIDVTS